MSDKKDGINLSKIFKGAAKLALWSIPIALGIAFLTEPLIFAWAHANPGGQALMAAADPFFQSVFDTVGITDGSFALAEWMTEMTGGASAVALNDPQGYGMQALDFYMSNG